MVGLAHHADLAGWQAAADAALCAGTPPERFVLQTPGTSGDLFGDHLENSPDANNGGIRLPRAFLDIARRVICHDDPTRLARLYRIAWRLQRDPHLLSRAHDGDIAWLTGRDKAVRRDVHKMHAFVRFRRAGTSEAGRERYAAWFEPAFHIERLVAPFFQKRFTGMDWLIVTPNARIAWDGHAITSGPGGSRADVPAEDALEDHWRAYFAAIFNPARLKVQAMTSEMPKKYWKNLPEASLIPGLIAGAEASARQMQERANSPENPRTAAFMASRADIRIQSRDDAWTRLRKDALTCQRCALGCTGSRTVFGEGPRQAHLMIVGEQPGDEEDLAGRPFVGPAGSVLNEALVEAGIDRKTIYLTNAVKHFKYQVRGKRRLHQRPTMGEIDHCRFWLMQERALVQPRAIIMLGASAARAVTGKSLTVREHRGRPMMLADGTTGFLTVHPADVLRLPDPAAQAEARAFLVSDLTAARTWSEGVAA